MSESTAQELTARNPALIVAATFAAWIVPGLGHLFLLRWGRALVFFLAVGSLAITGYLLRGNVFRPHSADAFDFLGYLADLGSGIFYFLAKTFERSGSDVSRAAGDYGTRFITTAGVANLLCVLDAYGISCGKKD